tara:strand:- start:410 stop:553 length:144 start_codon:yes stop_codon:yes gene_type:complete
MIHAAVQLAGLLLAVVSAAVLFGLWAGALAAGLAAVVVSAALEAGSR